MRTHDDKDEIMDRKRNIPQEETVWRVLRTKLDVEHVSLYANGRQQAKIILYVEAQERGQPVRLTQTEKDNIRLIDYHHGGMQIPLDDADGSFGSYKGWSSQRQFRGYLYHPNTQPSEGNGTPTPDAEGDYVEIYLSATDEAMSGSLTVGFIVTGDNGWAYRTDGFILAPGQEPVASSIIDTGDDKKVTAYAPPVYPVSDFQLDRRSGTNSDVAPDAGIFNDAVTLSIVHAGQTIDVRDMECEPAGLIHWKDDYYDAQDPCYTGYARPGETSIHWNERVPIGGQPLPTLAYPVANKGIILLCGRVDIRRGDNPDPPSAPVAVRLTDAYGSTQRFRLGFVRDERDVLEIS
jgi:hypothetical protein